MKDLHNNFTTLSWSQRYLTVYAAQLSKVCLLVEQSDYEHALLADNSVTKGTVRHEVSTRTMLQIRVFIRVPSLFIRLHQLFIHSRPYIFLAKDSARKNTHFTRWCFIKYGDFLTLGARGGAASWGTVLQAGRPQVWFPMVSLKFCIAIILPAHYDPGVDSVSNRNENQEYFLRGVRAASA
jgi:hypothetical protein